MSITYTGVGGLAAANLRLAYMIENEVRAQLADMASIRNAGVLRYAGDLAGSGSAALRLRYASIGSKTPLASTAEGGTVAATTPTYSTSLISVARSSLRYDITDEAAWTGLGRDLDPFALATSMSSSAEARFMEIICATFSGATTSAGSTVAQLTLDDFMDAIYALQLADNGSNMAAVLHPRQVNQLTDSLRSESNNAMSWANQTLEFINRRGQGYVGNLCGVDVWRSSHVPLDGGSTFRIGGIFGSDPGASGIAYAIGTQSPILGADSVRPAGIPVTVEFERVGTDATTRVIANLYAGAAITEDARIVKVQSLNA
jgi:hypothetical protein